MEKHTSSDLTIGCDAHSPPGGDSEHATTAHDAVFGEITDKGPNYRNVGWLGTTALMMKTQIGLGVLSIPASFDVLGLIPGMLCMIAIAIITTWSDYIIGVFKRRHPEVYCIDDAGAKMFGRVGREVLGIGFCIYWIFVAGSGMIGMSIGLNAVSTHGACTAVFVVVAAIVCFACASIRTLGRISWLAWFGLACIMTAILVVTIAVGIQDRPATAPPHGPWASDFKLFKKPTFTSAISAVSALVFAYAGTPAFFNIVSEMRDPRQYTRSLLVCQSGVTTTYTAIGCVVYYFCGSYVASPALGSAGVFMKKVAYGLALPGLTVTTTLSIHLPAKCAFVRILRGSRHLTANTLVHWAVWLGCTFCATLIAYLVASGIPEFGALVSLVGALLGTLMSFQPMGCMWLYDNWGKRHTQPGWGIYLHLSTNTAYR
ncbi:hypothetical protein ACCO45_010407 [Purpureocillium lilacinum]|uniref:Uncharacterized protein n=1 Tax=Purpureocillium lilacinum TaxID=33203 RepID=A0ACC4DEV4_PURLI